MSFLRRRRPAVRIVEIEIQNVEELPMLEV